MATMMAYAAPQQYMWNAQASAPSGWSGPWPPGAPASFPGPPPVPNGVDPNAWRSGQWQFNPMFVPSAAVAGQAWAPHPVWGTAAAMHAAQQAQPSADFNPYKRQPVPPSEEYKATKLVANPLGLENMIPRSELEKDPSVTLPPTTPWLWTPQELSNEDDARTAPNSRGGQESRDRREHRERSSSAHVSTASASASSRYSQRQPSTPQPQASSSSQSQQQPLRRSSTMQSSHDPSSHSLRERSDHVSRSSDPRTPPPSAPAGTSSFSSHYQQHQLSQTQSHPASQSHSRAQSREPSSHRDSQHERQRYDQRQSQQPYRQQTDPSTPAHEPPRTSMHVSSASAQARSREEKRSEAFSSKEALRPTFSPGIVRTPMHYNGPSASSGSANATPSRRTITDESRDDHDLTRRLVREESVSNRSSPARRDSTRRSGRDHSSSRYKDREYERTRAENSDDESPVRPQFRGPIYGPPTPAPGASRSSTNGTRYSSTSQESSSKLPSLTSSLSTMSVDTAPNSASSSSGLFLASFSDEPDGMLSPLIVGGTVPSTKSSPRDLGRSQTYPSISSHSQPENARSPPPPISRTPSKTPRPSPSQPSPTHIRSPSSVSRSRTYPTLANDPLAGEPPVIPPKPPTSRAPSPHRPLGRSPPTRNPLPAPPIPVSYSTSSSSASAAAAAASQHQYPRSRTQSQSQYSSPPSYNRHSPSSAPQPASSRHSPYSSASAPTAATTSSASSASAAAARHAYGSSTTSSSPYPHSYPQARSTPVPAPQPQSSKVRHGFWNRRGDHLVFVPTSSGSPKSYIVYAPRDLANPEELAQYPGPLEGWRNHHGEVRRYDPSVPELPESLPSHGDPPLRPYSSFIYYVSV